MERNSEVLLLRLLMLLEGILNLLLRLKDGLYATKKWLLLVEEGRLHRLEHEVVLAHHWVDSTVDLLLLVLLLGIEEDARLILAREVLRAVSTLLRRDYLDIAMVWQEFHVRWAVEEHFAWDGR